MTVPNKPFWLSQANSEFGGNGWTSNILSKAGISIPRYVGELAGKSAFSIIRNPGNPVAENADGMLYFWRSGNDVWGGGSGITNAQLTKGICQIRVRHTGGDGVVIFSGTSNNSVFTPDGTRRGVGCRAPGYPGYEVITAAIDFILNGAVVRTVNITAEGSTYR